MKIELNELKEDFSICKYKFDLDSIQQQSRFLIFADYQELLTKIFIF